MNRIREWLAEFDQAMASAPVWFQDVFGGTSIWDMILNNSLQVLTVGAVGWLVATWFERRHLKELDAREIPMADIRANTFKQPPSDVIREGTLLVGSVVVAHDYFRTLIILIRKLIGGNIRYYERLVMRGRREALLRLKEEARLRGLDTVVNVRFTAAVVTGRFLTGVEMVAYGTGVRTEKGVE